MAKAQHAKNFYKLDSDPTRCDKKDAGCLHFSAAGMNVMSPAGSVTTQVYTALEGVPLITVPYTPIELHELACRRANSNSPGEERGRRCSAYLVQDFVPEAHHMHRDMLFVMQLWHNFITEIYQCYSDKFWRFFLQLHSQPGVAIDAALGAVKSLFIQDNGILFPRNRKSVLRKIARLPQFWPQVMHTVRIDLRKYELPKGVTCVDFKFVDPVFAWLHAAQRQPAHDMHWKPAPAYRQGEPAYGGGVQQGRSFAEACRSCPAGAYPMCFSLHWDGTGAFGLSAAPICIGVANTNSASSDTQFCLGYMPILSGLGKRFHSSTQATEIKFYIRQQAVAAILRVLEVAATIGVLCSMKNCRGSDVNMLLMPRLLCVNIDQPEAQLYYGMKNRWSCSKCKRREGYSAFRVASSQDGWIIKRLYALAKLNSRFKEKAGETLSRYGFNPERECILHHEANKLLVRVPCETANRELFPSVDFRDKMHGLMIFLQRVLMEGSNAIRWENARGQEKVQKHPHRLS